VQFRRLAAIVGVLAFVSLGCGSDGSEEGAASSTTAAAPSAEVTYEKITADGHGDGETEGHDLALGDNTPKEPAGRFVLHHGDRGPDVETLHQRLAELGAPLESSELFSDETLHSVLEFQKAEGLVADGVVGNQTWAALDDPEGEVDWTAPLVPEEYSTEAPTGSVPGQPTPPSTSQPAGRGDAHAVGPQTAANSGSWARAVITLSDETATFYDTDGNIVLQAPISSGRDNLTPVGSFHVQSKSERAWASGGSGVYMDWMTRFNGGIGFHSIPKTAAGVDLPTPLGQTPVSHGCIRMADDQAKIVFENLRIGALVEVHA
jgi:lipoprotein-anchoring transpeptidase ErfK/SrfK